jgi:YD repeat-containing protein
MGIPGMGGGPYGGRRGGGGGGNESDQDRERMQEFLNPSRSLTVAEAKKDVEIDMFDDQERKSAFFTDGRKLQKTKDNTTQEIAAHWDGNRLVTDEKSPSGRKISRTYELSYDGTQLYETLRLTRGRSDSQTSIRYVYDQADARTAHSSQTRQ